MLLFGCVLKTSLPVGVVEVRERGIFYGSLFISWKRINNWHWESRGGNPMAQWSGAVEPQPGTLNLKLSPPLLFRRSIPNPSPKLSRGYLLPNHQSARGNQTGDQTKAAIVSCQLSTMSYPNYLHESRSSGHLTDSAASTQRVTAQMKPEPASCN